MSSEKRESPLMIALKDILAGSIGGVGQVFTGHPLDTIKVRLQTQPVGAPLYSGTLDCLKKTIAEEGFAGLYKGVASPLVGLCVMNAVMFLSYGQAKKIIQGDSNRELSVAELTKAGAVAGFTIAFVESPVDLFKSQLQVQYAGNKQYNGLLDCATKIFQQRGVRGIYQGLGATLVRDVPANATYFGVYELSRRFFLSEGQRLEQLPAWKVMLAGGIGGMSYWTLTYPVDVIKSSIQTDSIVPSQRRYANMMDCASKIYKQQGIAGFYKGFTPCFIRSFPANAACFVLYEKAREIMA
ncbi:mitochondrial substrate carrier family protein [Heterostelium album PN500]|uniref:Mitochondrial substrate carrier family protein n=1 Tax=Heterostelium pallidum (strain ATCC 26659 / Pp 5 / PN500) TaxID=670386 RepID=D3B5I3_HETP5|nr:mitochondrial substrate carrier family protein [Heterostelium album PN500]EFA83131.1 mitochondrial substrate carrier family protein [Heterostelium album PN500]|eukprot:XP_020435248.1 mitochondrial substrate carrier family protein [Heterostelium album PN500]